jgi:hypothetical protein
VDQLHIHKEKSHLLQLFPLFYPSSVCWQL